MNYEESIRRYMLMESKDRKKKNMDIMEKYFVYRTKKHISRVQGFIDSAIEFFPEMEADLRGRGAQHDMSKFYIPERKHYIILTWKYKCAKEGVAFSISDKESEHIRDTTFHHCKNNPHHPEYWDKSLKINPVNKESREKRDVIADASAMDDLSVIEMVCDWSAMSAMSVENGEPGPKKWADESIKDRWKFSKHQQDLIYEVIDLLWR